MSIIRLAIVLCAIAVALGFTWSWGYDEGRHAGPACVPVSSHTEAAHVWLDGKTPCEGGR